MRCHYPELPRSPATLELKLSPPLVRSSLSFTDIRLLSASMATTACSPRSAISNSASAVPRTVGTTCARSRRVSRSAPTEASLSGTGHSNGGSASQARPFPGIQALSKLAEQRRSLMVREFKRVSYPILAAISKAGMCFVIPAPTVYVSCEELADHGFDTGV